VLKNSVKTIECGEKFVKIDSLFCEKIAVDVPQFVRVRVAEKLRVAAGMLPHDYKLILHEGWRSFERQSELFKHQRAITVSEHPDWSDAEVDIYTHNFVAIPSKDALNPSPHATGGAVDVSIQGLDMGCEFLEMSERTRTDYYSENETFASNRKILLVAMENAGFINFPYEWWHFEYGIDTWAKVNNSDAFYGGVYAIDEMKL